MSEPDPHFDQALKTLRSMTARETLEGHEPRWRFRLVALACYLTWTTQWRWVGRVALWLALPEWEP